ncbi:MAG: response regulator [ANME-2 cluster archaeon]|nr:response regulator [ANME-2 cluster archaeon]
MVHLFVAEDSKLIREVIRTIIEDHASEVIRSDDGLAAVSEFEHEGDDIMFLDLGMPDEKGLRAVYDIINSIPEATVDVYRTGPEKKGPENVLHSGLDSAIQSVAVMANKTAKYNIIKEKIIKKDGLEQCIARSSLGVFFEISGDMKGGAALMLPMKDILNTMGVFKIDFTVQEGTTQKIINELGSVLIKGILEVMEKKMQKKFSLGIATPVMGNSLGKRFNDVLEDDDECTILTLQLVVDNKNINTSFIISWVPP